MRDREREGVGGWVRKIEKGMEKEGKMERDMDVCGREIGRVSDREIGK